MRAEIAMGRRSQQTLNKAKKLHSWGLYSAWRNNSKESKIYRCVLFALAEGKCPSCGVDMVLSFYEKANEFSNSATLDHVDPISKTMEHNKLNLQIMCKKCNSEKRK